MIDSHAHLQDEMLKDYKLAVKDANKVGVEKIICSSSDIKTSKRAVEMANEFDCVYATVGVHPEEAGGFDDNCLLELKQLAKNKKVVAIGEIGLDYYHEFASRDKQKEAFIKQIELADKLGLPVVIHSREATGDLMEILRNNMEKLKNGVCIHCFNLSIQILKEVMGYGFYISIGGIVTFKNAKNVIDVVRECNLDKLMLETDTPYLSPVPLRGTINEPKNIVLSAVRIAEILGLSLEELDGVTTENTLKFFKIKE